MPYVLGDWTVQFSNGTPTEQFTDQELPYSDDDLAEWSQGSKFDVESPTWVIIDVVLHDLCNPDTSEYTLHYEFYVDVSTIEDNGVHTICPGDTTTAWISS